MADRPFNPQDDASSDYVVPFGGWRTFVLHIPVYIVGSLIGCLGVKQIESRREMEKWRLDTDRLAKALTVHAPHVGAVKRY